MNSKFFLLGGDINKSLAEGYKFDLIKLFQDAFKITQKHFLPLLSACLFIILLLSALFSQILDKTITLDDPRVVIGYFFFALVIAPPLMAGLLMMGVHHSIGLKTKSFYIFNYFNLLLKLSLAAVMIALMTNVASMVLTEVLGSIGFVLSVIILLYLKMSFCLVYPLIAEKKASPILALKLSFKLVHKNIGQFTQLLIIFCFLFFIGLISYGFAFFFIIPFCINMLGLIYRQICGVGISVTETPDDEITEDNDDDNDNDNNNNNSGPKRGGFEA